MTRKQTPFVMLILLWLPTTLVGQTTNMLTAQERG
jgi:hypothetical protein